jgi:precorrin-6B methylase 2
MVLKGHVACIGGGGGDEKIAQKLVQQLTKQFYLIIENTECCKQNVNKIY